ncbi:MAG: hypothetical protein ACREPQ_18650 [Rhodanobacter sp.]
MNSPQALSACLANHPWLAGVYVGSGGALLLLNPSGHAALRSEGRQSLLDHLHAHLAAHAIDPVRNLRLLDAMPTALDAAEIERLLQTPRPDRATLLAEHAQDGGWKLTLQLPLELIHFDGHFPRAPVLPGVLQIAWALALAAPRLGTSTHCREMEALKFQHLLHPGDRVELSLHFDAGQIAGEHGKLHFAYHLDGAHCSSGRLRVERAHD